MQDLPVGLPVAGPSLAGSATSKGGIPIVIPSDQRWLLPSHVLATSTFPGTTTLRSRGRNKEGKGICSCEGLETHRDFFGFCRQIVSPSMKDDKPLPEVKVCWNAENLFECKLNTKLTGLRDRLEFKNLPTVGSANKVLFEGTYWFPRLLESKIPTVKHSRNGLAVLRLLAGLPSYSGKERVDQLVKMRIAKGAVNKLRSILATVDGLLMQLTLSFPDRENFLNWERLDQVTHCMVSLLVSDYFRDRDLDLDRLSTFEKVKKLRKAIKEKAFNQVGDMNDISVPREMSFFEIALGFIADKNRPIDIYRATILSQTRASGVPPRSVYNKSFKEIKDILVEAVDPSIYEGVKRFIKPSVESVHFKVLERLGSESNTERFWRKCLDMAKISLSDSGEFFTNSESGGKLEAARLVLSGPSKIRRINLFNGEKGEELDKSSEAQGELLFHWALNMFHDRTKCYEQNLMSVRISLVAELGKYRAITVSHLAHAVLLHVLSHVILEYLKGVPSSESGVGAANHAWNFFKRLSHKNPNANFIFGDKDSYLFSTDWKMATDYCDHKVSQATLNCLCQVLGIPNWYRQTCVFALCAPRQVEFIDPKGKTLELFYTTRGELMGDPVVKGILHYQHLIAREASIMSIDAIRQLLS